MLGQTGINFKIAWFTSNTLWYKERWNYSPKLLNHRKNSNSHFRQQITNDLLYKSDMMLKNYNANHIMKWDHDLYVFCWHLPLVLWMSSLWRQKQNSVEWCRFLIPKTLSFLLVVICNGWINFAVAVTTLLDLWWGWYVCKLNQPVESGKLWGGHKYTYMSWVYRLGNDTRGHTGWTWRSPGGYSIETEWRFSSHQYSYSPVALKFSTDRVQCFSFKVYHSQSFSQSVKNLGKKSEEL